MHTFTVTLTEDELTKLQALLAKNGLDVNSTTGTLPEQDGVILSYSIRQADPAGVAVDFTVEHKRFFESNSAIERHVHEMIDAAVAADQARAANIGGDDGTDAAPQDDAAAGSLGAVANTNEQSDDVGQSS